MAACITCSRILVLIDAILIWLIGGAIAGFSLWLLVDFWINEYIQATEQLEKYRIATYIFLSGGFFLLVISIVGICGAVKPKFKCLLICYLVCLCVAMGTLIGGTVWCYIYRVEIKYEVENSQIITQILQKDYGKDSSVTRAIDFMQVELQCCGGVSYLDYKHSDWQANLGTPDKPNPFSSNDAPFTCCSDYKRYENAQSIDYQFCSICNNIISGDSGESCAQSDLNPLIWKKGCGEAIVEFFVDNLGIAAGIVIGILVCQILGVIFTAVLLCNTRQSSFTSNDDDVVYEMARSQEKSPYPTRGTGPYANLYNS